MSGKTWQKEKVKRNPQTFTYPPSSEQQDIFDCLRFEDVNIHGEAGAGSGKTTTALRAMGLSHQLKHKTGMMAFNRAIVDDIEPRLPHHVQIGTAHSFGYRAFMKKFGKSNIPDRRKGEPSKTEAILSDMIPDLDPTRARGSHKGDTKNLLYSLEKLIGMVKVTLTDWNDMDKVYELIDRYNIDFVITTDNKPRDFFEEFIRPVFSDMMDQHVARTHVIDFSDMIWLPIQYNIPIEGFDMLYCDEWQDASPMMLELAARMVGEDGRVLTIGDRFQSIYGWAGADIHSIDKTIERFNSKQLPLMTCYRCGHKIIEEVNKIMPNLRAFEKNPQGEVITHYDPSEFKYEEIPDGAMILCRRNSGLVRPCFEFLKRGRKAIIKGQDIGDNLIYLIDNLNAHTMTDFKESLLAWREEKITAIEKRKRPSQEAIQNIEDQYEALMALSENCMGVHDVKNKISMIFTDKKTPGVTLSSMHKSKGLEADEVVIVQADRMRLSHEKMKPEDHEQERNLEYVAKTRAKNKLTMVWS